MVVWVDGDVARMFLKMKTFLLIWNQVAQGHLEVSSRLDNLDDVAFLIKLFSRQTHRVFVSRQFAAVELFRANIPYQILTVGIRAQTEIF